MLNKQPNIIPWERNNVALNHDMFQQQAFFSTVRITISDPAGTTIGTGFIVQVLVDTLSDKGVTVLVSNKHVFGDPKRQIVLNFHKRTGAGQGPLLGSVHKVSSNDFSGGYIPHPDKDVDLAALNISNITRDEGIFYRALPEEMFCDCSDSRLIPGETIVFVGYPQGLFDSIHNLPILRKGTIASIPQVDFNGKKEMIIDAQVFPGSSGSPVFLMLRDGWRLVGVIAQTISVPQELVELKKLPAGHPLGVEQPLGLGVVLKTELLKELVNEARRVFRKKLGLSETTPSGSVPVV